MNATTGMNGMTRRIPGLLGLLALCAALGLAGCISIDLPGGRPGPLVESELEGEGPDKVLLLEVEGVLREETERRAFGLGVAENPVARIRAQLEKAREDAAVRAVVLRIHSPGGTATASEILYREILRFREEQGVPVIAELMGVATSGAYYVAMAADAVYAHPTTVTGSIGVIFAGVNVSGLMEKLGIEDQTFTAGRYKDAGSPLRGMRDDERDLIQSVLDDLHQRFRQVVAEGRPALGAERVARLADGRILSAPQAMESGLIDGIVDLPGALAEARRRAGIERARVVAYHRNREWSENIYTRPLAPSAPRLDPFALLERLGAPDFYYLWWPGL